MMTQKRAINLSGNPRFALLSHQHAPTHWALGIYESLQLQLDRKKVYSWMDTVGGELIHCSSCEVDNSCCMKRKLILAVTRKILRWLHDNKAQLQDIDYADDGESL